MEQITQNKLLAGKIEDLKKKAPYDWAERIAEELGKKRGSIYAYAKCERGVRRGYPQMVLKLLQQMVAETEKEIKKMTA